MIFSQYIAIIRDVAIVSAVLFVCWKLVDYGEDKAQLADFRALQAQVAHDQQIQQQWNASVEKADAQREQDMASINTRIDAQHTPIIVRVPSPAQQPVLSGPSAAPGGEPAGSGGIDIRPGVNAFEHKYESALADCRDALARWPSVQ